jgi:hypothetical protein
MTTYFKEVINHVINTHKQRLVNNTPLNNTLMNNNLMNNQWSRHNVSRNNTKQIKAQNKRYSQEMNRRKHQIKQPGVDVQRKNSYRKTRN